VKKVIYTTIIGDYDYLEEPDFIPKGYDFICFTDQKINTPYGSVWNIKQIPSLYADNTRTARKYKILPHRYLPEYDISIWTDGNEIIVGDVNKLQEAQLSNQNMAVYNHMSCWDKRDCAYQEAEAIFALGKQNNSWKDDPTIIQEQMNRYNQDGYPRNNGLIVSGVMFRKHNSPDVINCMEAWWSEIKYGSRRDQLSFNYAAWKTQTTFNWINQDIRDDGYVLEVKHTHQKKK
jgi:hypothetical protein